MTKGVGGSTPDIELAKLCDMTAGAKPIPLSEFSKRIQKALRLMKQASIEALYLNAGSNLYYFTGMRWHSSERMVGAVLSANGGLSYIAPAFEVGTLRQYMVMTGPIHSWEEHESPYGVLANILSEQGLHKGRVGLSEDTPFFISNGLAKACPDYNFIEAKAITAGCRSVKSEAELALMQRAKDMTLAVHKATAKILKAGMSTHDVEAFIDAAHKAVGASKGSYFKIVLFGEASSFPHGVKEPQILKDGDMVLIDTGCKLHDYISDITRSYVFGEPTDYQRQVWNAEKSAQAAAFKAAQIGVRCGDVDLAARQDLETHGFGPTYNLPGLPHRTGHGIGLDIHEWPYLNWGDDTLLEPGMCFSNEPMICVPGKFGIRLEDHFYMTPEGPEWFTQPSKSIDDPFG